MKSMNKANSADAVKQRAVRFDYVPQPVGEGHKQNYPKEAHYLAFVGRAGSESLKGTELAEKLNKPAPKLRQQRELV